MRKFVFLFPRKTLLRVLFAKVQQRKEDVLRTLRNVHLQSCRRQHLQSPNPGERKKNDCNDERRCWFGNQSGVKNIRTHLNYSDRALTREKSSFTSVSSRPGRQKKSTNTCLSCCALREGCFKFCRTFVNIASVKATQEEERRVLNPQHAEYSHIQWKKQMCSTSTFSSRASVTSLTEE